VGVAGAEDLVAAVALFAVQVPEFAPGAGGGEDAAAVLGADGLVGGEGGVGVSGRPPPPSWRPTRPA
jgi:hypothetical protein